MAVSCAALEGKPCGHTRALSMIMVTFTQIIWVMNVVRLLACVHPSGYRNANE